MPAVNRISQTLRQAGGLVVYIQKHPGRRGHPHLVHLPGLLLHAGPPPADDRCVSARWPTAHALWPGLEVRPDDLIVRKSRFGAFAPGASDLDAILRARGVDTLIITGTATQVCCESTARDAMMLNYKVFFVADGNATFTEEEHNANAVGDGAHVL